MRQQVHVTPAVEHLEHLKMRRSCWGRHSPCVLVAIRRRQELINLDAVLVSGEGAHELLLGEVNELALEGVERSGGDGRELERHRFCDSREGIRC